MPNLTGGWGVGDGDGILGCEIGFGYLHGIPPPWGESVSGNAQGVASVAASAAAAPPETDALSAYQQQQAAGSRKCPPINQQVTRTYSPTNAVNPNPPQQVSKYTQFAVKNDLLFHLLSLLLSCDLAEFGRDIKIKCG